MIKYPTDLPFPQLSSTSFKQQSNILRTEMGSGRARQRRMHFSVPTIMAATFRLNSSKATILEGFYEHGLINNEWFLMKIPTPRGLVEHQVRFMKSPLENYKPLGAGKWQYQANIEVKRYQKPNEEQMIEQLLKPQTYDEFTNSVTNSINSYLE